MISLRELQRSFLRHLRGESDSGVQRWIVDGGISADRRLQIYRNNRQLSFASALEAMFPALLRLGGPDWFGQMARAYQCKYPSRCGDLQPIGARLAGYLQEQFGDGEYAYFADVARLEWAYQECLSEAESAPAELAGLGAVPADAAGTVRFVIDPTARSIDSIYPLLAIWNANRGDPPPDPAPIDLRSGASRLLLIRRSDHVEMRELAPPVFALLRAFASGMALAPALEAVSAAHSDFDPSNALARLIKLEVLVGFDNRGEENDV